MFAPSDAYRQIERADSDSGPEMPVPKEMCRSISRRVIHVGHQKLEDREFRNHVRRFWKITTGREEIVSIANPRVNPRYQTTAVTVPNSSRGISTVTANSARQASHARYGLPDASSRFGVHNGKKRIRTAMANDTIDVTKDLERYGFVFVRYPARIEIGKTQTRLSLEAP